MNLDCLTNLVGYVPSECPCLQPVPDGFPSVTESKTGLFLSDVMPTDLIASCGDATLWDTLKRLRKVSDIKFHQRLLEKLKTKGSMMPAQSGYIGNDSGAIEYNSPPWGGPVLKVKRNRRGVYAIIDSIQVKSSSIGGTVNLMIHDESGNELYNLELLIPDNANVRWVNIELPEQVRIPLWSDGTEKSYYFVWNSYGNALNEQSCFSCTGGSPWYSKWFDVLGGNTYGAPSDIQSYFTTEYLNGIRLNVSVQCAFDALLCAASSDVKTAIAVCLQYSWSIEVLEFILSSGQINTWTSLGGEYLEGVLQYNQGRLNDNIDYLSEILYTGECIQCNSPISRVGLRK